MSAVDVALTFALAALPGLYVALIICIYEAIATRDQD